MNIKRNRKILDYFKDEKDRLGVGIQLKELFEQEVLSKLLASELVDIMSLLQDTEGVPADVLNNDTALIETLKLIGLMEASKDEKELQKLLEKKKKNKGSKKELTDFDKILKGILSVPKPKEDKEPE